MKSFCEFTACITLLLALLSFELAHASSSAFVCERSMERTSSLLLKTQAAYENVAHYSADFRQYSFLAALDVSEQSTGKMYFSRPGKMRWEYSAPDEQIFVTNDGVLWLYQPLDKQLELGNFRDAFITDLPVSFLMGVGNLRQKFDLKSACHSSEGLVLELSPKRAKDEEALKGFKLLVSSEDYRPLGAEVEDVSGNVTAFILTNSTILDDADGSLYKIDVPDGTDVIDRR